MSSAGTIAKFLHAAGGAVLVITVIFYLRFAAVELRTTAPQEEKDALALRRMSCNIAAGVGVALIAAGFVASVIAGAQEALDEPVRKLPPSAPSPSLPSAPGDAPRS